MILRLLFLILIAVVVYRLIVLNRTPAAMLMEKLPQPSAASISLMGMLVMALGVLGTGSVILYMMMYRPEGLPQALIVGGALLFGCGWIATSIGRQRQ